MSIKENKSFFFFSSFPVSSIVGFWMLMRALKTLFVLYHSCYQLISGLNFNKSLTHTSGPPPQRGGHSTGTSIVPSPIPGSC